MKGIVASIALILILLFGISESRTFQGCAQKHSATSASSYVERGQIILECSGEFFTENRDPLTTLSTLLLVFVTGGLVWFGWRQVSTTRTQLRAYIGVDEMRDPGLRKLEWEQRGAGSVMYVLAAVKNHGSTPALNVEYNYNLKYMQGLPDDKTIPKITYKGSSVLQPDQETVLRIETQASQADYETVRTGFSKINGFNVWAYGFVSYFDVYGNKHFTRYCFCLDFLKGTREIPGWIMYQRFNDTEQQTLGFFAKLGSYILKRPFRWGIYTGSLIPLAGR